MAARVNIGILGAGTVGSAVHDLIAAGHLARFGVDAEVVKVFTRTPQGKPRYETSPELFTTDATEVTRHPDVDIVVEVLAAGGAEDLRIQKEWVVDALRHGKSVATANKALLVAHGAEIWTTARESGRAVRFEACVAGGIPIISPLTQSLSAERPAAVYGLLNGTSNYILTEMSQHGRSYEDALASAQALGYAEADPDADVSGRDAEAKLLLLSSITFGTRLQPGAIHRKGIERIHAIDFLYAARKGRSTIKSVALARSVDGALEAMVTPMIVPERHPIAGIDGVTNAVFFKGQVSDGGASEGDDWDYVFAGPGAGGGATAVAVLGDVHELTARSGDTPFLPVESIVSEVDSVLPEDELRASFYVRFVVRDQSGIVGDICQVFGEKQINVAEIWQLEHGADELESLLGAGAGGVAPEEILPFVITLEQTNVGQLRQALARIAQKDYVLAEPLWLPIWKA
ncbi:MAG: homoserine dehydrogenase [Deltaproteobacteria bacterium]|nr:homoserine dehydrogenase [Deltaproteobacteria bacterium]